MPIITKLIDTMEETSATFTDVSASDWTKTGSFTLNNKTYDIEILGVTPDETDEKYYKIDKSQLNQELLKKSGHVFKTIIEQVTPQQNDFHNNLLYFNNEKLFITNYDDTLNLNITNYQINGVKDTLCQFSTCGVLFADYLTALLPKETKTPTTEEPSLCTADLFSEMSGDSSQMDYEESLEKSPSSYLSPSALSHHNVITLLSDLTYEQTSESLYTASSCDPEKSDLSTNF
jgi:hypothetical protein